MVMMYFVRLFRSMPSLQNALSSSGVSRNSTAPPCSPSGSTPCPRRIIGSTWDVPITMPYSSASFWIQRIILAETIVPHRRPQIVGLQAGAAAKHVRVKLVICNRRIFPAPSPVSAGASSLYEDAAVFDDRRALQNVSRPSHKARTLCSTGTSAPPIPRRDAHLLGQNT